MTEVFLGDNIEAGICVFAECEQLESVTINYRNDRISIGAFGQCKSLNSVTIPKTIKSIEGLAFYGCTKLTSFNFDNIENIASRAFQDCSIIDLSFNNNYYFIQTNAFENIMKLTSITFNSNCGGVIQPNAFRDDKGLTSVTVTLPLNMLYTPYDSSGNGGSFPGGCDVSGGSIGSGVVGIFKLTSIGTGSTDRAFTATATTSSTATGATIADALSQLLSNASAESGFIGSRVNSFQTEYGSSGSTRHILDFTLGG